MEDNEYIWLAGFIDAKGKFRFRRYHDRLFPYFSMGVNSRFKDVLLKIHSMLEKCGGCYIMGKNIELRIRNIKDIFKLIYTFDKCPLKSKSDVYSLWKEGIYMVKNKSDKTEEGRKKMMKIAEEVNGTSRVLRRLLPNEKESIIHPIRIDKDDYPNSFDFDV